MKKIKNFFALATVLSLTFACSTSNNLIETPEQVQANSWSWSSGGEDEEPVLNNTSTFTYNNKVSLLIDREEIFPEIYKTIENAKKSVYISTYLFGGSVGHEIATRLIAKHKEGVQVRFLAEQTMGVLADLVNPAKKEFKYMQDNGVEVKYFPVDLMPKGPTFISNQKLINHSKMVVADGTTAIIGGMNYLDTEAVNHDYMIKVEGSAASELAKIGDTNWVKSRLLKIQALDSIGSSDTLPTPPSMGNSTIEIAKTWFEDQSIDDMIIRNIYNAKTSIDIQMLLLDHQDVVNALIEAHKRGVNVRIVLEEVEFGKYNKILDKLPLEGMANFASVSALVEAGLNVKWYKTSVKDRFLHAKTALFDKRLLTIGSANFTYHALTRNHEVSVTTDSPEATSRYASNYEVDWVNSTKPVQLTSTQKSIGKTFRKILPMIYQNKTEKEIQDAVYRDIK